MTEQNIQLEHDAFVLWLDDFALTASKVARKAYREEPGFRLGAWYAWLERSKRVAPNTEVTLSGDNTEEK